MKVTILNGNARHGSTWHVGEAFLNALQNETSVEMKEFVLPRDLPHFCNGCFSCFFRGEATCPHAQFVEPIAAAILEADLVVLASPTYGLDVSGQMKAFIDHLCYMWVSHRPDPKMFSKIGLTIATTAGAGIGHTTKTMRSSLRFWGVKRLYSLKERVTASKWEEVPEKKRKKVLKDAEQMAKRVAGAFHRIDRLHAPFLRTVMLRLMAGTMKSNTWNPADRAHWVQNGWIKGEQPEKANLL